MNLFLEKYNDLALLFLRLVFGLEMLVQHGWGKGVKLFTGDPSSFPDPLGVGSEASLALTVLAEGLCAFLVTIGLFTRWATLLLIITMGVAFLIVHMGDPWADREMALLYLAAFVAIGVFGPGRYSIDDQWRNRS
ncbi:MAG: DoxX family protein [Saprospiraceae bacterium]|nr:DoxX family protein [Saprospiraceae bacterium]